MKRPWGNSRAWSGETGYYPFKDVEMGLKISERDRDYADHSSQQSIFFDEAEYSMNT